MAVPLPLKFKVPQVDIYDKPRDPVEYLETFKAYMNVHKFSREIACQAYPLTLKGMVRGWFGNLQAGSITSFKELHR